MSKSDRPPASSSISNVGLVDLQKRQSEARFEVTVQNAVEALLLIDSTNGQILDANQQACESMGYAVEEIQTLSIADIDTRFTATEPSSFRQQISSGVSSTIESEHRRKDGTMFPVEATVCFFELDRRSLELVLVRDITQRKQAEQATARLAEIGELAAMIVHEVRNPLTTILMAIDALQKINLPERNQQYLELAVEEAERLKRLLNEILLHTKQQVLQWSKLELNCFSAEVLESLKTMSDVAKYQIRFESSLSSVWIAGDPDKLRQVLINLLKNACEASVPEEEITWRIDPSVNDNQVCISIHNGGTLIPCEVLSKLGTPFFTTKVSGNGLGLAIVRRIVEAHKGELLIQSESDIGTFVRIHLPLLRS
jgi:PAS domain S-box-containing protein